MSEQSYQMLQLSSSHGQIKNRIMQWIHCIIININRNFTTNVSQLSRENWTRKTRPLDLRHVRALGFCLALFILVRWSIFSSYITSGGYFCDIFFEYTFVKCYFNNIIDHKWPSIPYLKYQPRISAFLFNMFQVLKKTDQTMPCLAFTRCQFYWSNVVKFMLKFVLFFFVQWIHHGSNPYRLSPFFFRMLYAQSSKILPYASIDVVAINCL